MIILDHLTRRYGTITAVNDLSLSVEDGEVLVFLGVNGAGKTTTIKLMTGLLAPCSGAVYIDGEEICPSNPSARRLFGYAPDQPELFPRLTAQETVKFSARLYGVYLTDSEATELLEAQDLARDRNRLVHGFSRGMKQRLSICLALAHKPRVLILDEPLVGLDPLGVIRMKALLATLAQTGHTIFLSTHSLSFAEESATRVAVIHHGTLCAVGDPRLIRTEANKSSSLEKVFFELTSTPDPTQADI